MEREFPLKIHGEMLLSEHHSLGSKSLALPSLLPLSRLAAYPPVLKFSVVRFLCALPSAPLPCPPGCPPPPRAPGPAPAPLLAAPPSMRPGGRCRPPLPSRPPSSAALGEPSATGALPGRGLPLGLFPAWEGEAALEKTVQKCRKTSPLPA